VSGWVDVLGLRGLDARLDGSLKAWLRARSTAPARHSTLRATLEWSHDLLCDDERLVLRRLAVFAGAFTMSAAEAVIADRDMTSEQVFELLASLIRKSMVTLLPGSGSRSYRLMDTTHAFAQEKLAESDDGERTRRRHAHHLLLTLERAIDEWETTGDAVWLRRYAPVLDDLRAALDWALGQDGDDAVALAGASWPLWRELSLLVEGRTWLRAAEARLRPETPPAREARLRRGLGELWANTGSVKAAHDEFARAAHIYRNLEDRPSLGGALSRHAFTLLMLGRPLQARQAVEEALGVLQQVRSPRTLGGAYSTQLCVEARFGRYDAARAIGERAVRLCEMTGADRTAFVISGNLMECALEKGDIDAAIDSGRDLEARLRGTSHSDVLAFVLGLLGAALTERGDLEEALTAARQAVQLLRDEGMLFGQFDHLALRAGLAGRIKDAARIIGYADWIYRAAGRPREPIGERAATRLATLLATALGESDIAILKDEGALLSEDQAMALALSV
jgi:tetratricopeptide (TPR) repeat protein